MTSRTQNVTLSPHEVLVVAFYRSLPLDRQLEIDGLFGLWWRDTVIHRAFVEEIKQLGAAHVVGGVPMLLATDMKPFIEESAHVAGVLRRAA